MRYISILVFLFCFTCNTSVCQISIEIGSGLDLKSRKSFDFVIPHSQFLSLHYGLSENIGIGIGYRRTTNSPIVCSSFYVESREFDLGVLVRESGRLSSNEVYFSSSYSVHQFNFKVGVGYVISRVNTNLSLSSIRLSNFAVHNNQKVNNRYEKVDFFRTSLQINYQIQLSGKLSFLPYVELLYGIRPSTNEYVLESTGSIKSPFDSVEEINDFNSMNKQLQHYPKFGVLGVGLKYDL